MAHDMCAPFAFAIDQPRQCLHVTKRGYWDMATVERFARSFCDALQRMRMAGGCRYCLVDASGFAIQSAEVAEALQRLVDGFDPACPAKMAGISGSALGKLQASRFSARGVRQIFATRGEAEHWLFGAAA
jgi:hypothetical protein